MAPLPPENQHINLCSIRGYFDSCDWLIPMWFKTHDLIPVNKRDIAEYSTEARELLKIV